MTIYYERKKCLWNIEEKGRVMGAKIRAVGKTQSGKTLKPWSGVWYVFSVLSGEEAVEVTILC